MEAEVSQYKHIVAEQTPHITVLKDVIEKKALRSVEKRELVNYSKSEHGISTRHALKIFSIQPSVYYYKTKPSDDQQIRDELESMAELHTRWGFWMMHGRLRNLY